MTSQAPAAEGLAVAMSNGLPHQSCGGKNTAGAAGAMRRSARQDCAVFGRLEEAEPDAADRHPPSHFRNRRMTGPKGEQNKANAHRRQTDLTQNAGRNASVDKVTFDVISPDRTIYDRVRESGVLSRAAVCRIFGIAATPITDHVEFDPALAIKFTIDRPMPSSSPGDTDVFGSQQYGPLLHIDVPEG
jgi:hypothetical protein